MFSDIIISELQEKRHNNINTQQNELPNLQILKQHIRNSLPKLQNYNLRTFNLFRLLSIRLPNRLKNRSSTRV